MDRTFVVGTRGSRLALAQTTLVVDALKAAHPDARFDVREITTQGDRDTKPLSEIGGQGVFTKAIEDALLAKTIDIAVHSMKDLPPHLTDGLVIAAVPERGDPRDALVTKDGRTLADLPPGARIGTGSARRAVQLKAMRPDVECPDIRGNVDTRIRKVDEGQYDAVVLAMAGLERLGVAARASQVFSVEQMVPSPGQGALAVETRSNDDEARELAAALEVRTVGLCVWAERAFLDWLGAGCKLPVGALARMDGEEMTILAMIADEEGKLYRHSRTAGARGLDSKYSPLERMWKRWRKQDVLSLPSGLAIQAGVLVAQELWNATKRGISPSGERIEIHARSDETSTRI